MQVTIYYFAILREIQGKDKESLSVQLGVTVGKLFDQLFNIQRTAVRFAVNEEFVPANTVLNDGDQVAFIPPLGGG